MTGALDYIQFVLAPQVLVGLVLGVAVILVALGLTIIFGLLDVINMSHGEFYALGAFVALALGAIGLPFFVLLALVPLLMLPVGYLVERWLIQRVFHSGDRHVTTLLLTFGLGLVMEDAFRLVFGPNPHKPETPIRGAVRFTQGNHGSLLDPSGAPAVTAEMQGEMASLLVSDGHVVQVANPSVIRTQ